QGVIVDILAGYFDAVACCQVDLQPPPRNLSSSSTSRRISRSSTFTSGGSFSRSSKNIRALVVQITTEQ
ncbi:hypothetical protein FRX31_013226, partial [Thalictrum thalictroides]